MERLGVDACLAQFGGDDLTGMLGGCKHQNPLPALCLYQMPQQLCPLWSVHSHSTLGDVDRTFIGQHIQAMGLVQQGIGQALHCGRKGGRKQQVLPACGQALEDGLQFFVKAKIQ